MNRPKRMILVASAAAAAAFFACGPDKTASTEVAGEPSISASASASPAKETAAPTPRPVALGRLPSKGLVVSNDEGTFLLNLDGTVLKRLRKFRLGGNPGAPGVWLQRGKHYFRLDLRHQQLAPVPRETARTRMYDEGPEPDLPPPDDARINGRIAGHWRYTYKSGGRTLAQWSGECEIPTAFWLEGDSLRIITGESRLADAPESEALGWSSNGEALVLVGEGACGKSGNPPGIYRFTSPGEGVLIYEARGFASAEMW